MITALLLVIGFVIIFQINQFIVKKEKERFPDITEAEVEQRVSNKTSTVAVLGLFLLIASVVALNTLYVSPDEKREEQAAAEKSKRVDLEKQKKIDLENEKIKKLGLTKDEMNILSQFEIRANTLDQEVVNAYNELKLESYHIDTEITLFTGLAKKAKDTEFAQRVEKTRDSLIKNQKKIAESRLRKAEKESADKRKKYGEDLRNLLLDREMDVKVSVFGKDNRKIKLTYILFNDVWFRKFETEGFFDKINNEGFTHIELSNGYDYGKGVKYD